jgi:hypothetical protein
MANDGFGNIDFNSVQAGQRFQTEQAAAGNVAAERQVGAALTEQKTGAVAGFFREEQQKTQQQVAVDEARTQTAHAKRGMQLQRENFDTGLANNRRLEKMDSAASQELLGREKQIQLDSFGRKQLSERQLADWYTTRAASEEDWSGYQQRTQQLHDRKLMILKASYAKIEQAEKQVYAKGQQDMEQDLLTELAKRKKEANDKILKQQAKSANRSAMISTLSTVGAVVGGVVASVYTLGAGGAAGAAAGGALAGGLAGAALSK